MVASGVTQQSSFHHYHPDTEETMSLQLKTGCGGTMLIFDEVLQHLEAHPNVLPHLSVAILRTRLPRDGRKLRKTVDLGQSIGFSDCVRTKKIGWNEPTTFALRLHRQRPSRVISGVRRREPTNRVSLIAVPYSPNLDRTYRLCSAWIGELAPMEPWDSGLQQRPAALQEAVEYWRRHALVYDPQVMGPITNTTWEQVCAPTNRPER